MPRIRTIKPSFFTSTTIADLNMRQRVLFIGLWTHCDDEGRCLNEARILKGALFPLDDDVTAQHIAVDLDGMENLGLIRRLAVDGDSIIQITNWKEHQHINRPTASKWQVPGALINDSRSAHGALTEDSRQEGKGRERKGKERSRGARARDARPARTARGSRLQPDWLPSTAAAAWAAHERPDLNIDHTIERFRDYWIAQPGQKGVKTDWAATFRNWVRNEKPGKGGPAQRRMICTTCKKPITGGYTGSECDPCWKKSQGIKT